MKNVFAPTQALYAIVSHYFSEAATFHSEIFRAFRVRENSRSMSEYTFNRRTPFLALIGALYAIIHDPQEDTNFLNFHSAQ